MIQRHAYRRRALVATALIGLLFVAAVVGGTVLGAWLFGGLPVVALFIAGAVSILFYGAIAIVGGRFGYRAGLRTTSALSSGGGGAGEPTGSDSGPANERVDGDIESRRESSSNN